MKFDDIKVDILGGLEWKVVAARRWRSLEAIHRLEGAALKWVVRRLGRNRQLHGSRLLHLGDNMSVICSAGKGRASCFGLTCVCRSLLAHPVACGFRITHRWIPSERNPGDGPSRWFQPFRFGSFEAQGGGAKR